LATKEAKRLAAPRFAAPRSWAVAMAIVAAAVAFGGALRGPFQFDDVAAIVRNPTIDQLSPIGVPLDPPSRTAVSGRPLVNYTLAISKAVNRALGIEPSPLGLPSSEAAGFRVANIIIHLLCGLLLFGIIRRSVRSPRIAKDWSGDADPLAGVVAMLWLVHPLNTEAVDYVIQRTELLVSLFYCLTLYAAIRSWDARKPRLWYAASITACLLGMWSKEVMVSAPLAVLLYDRAFRSDSWRDLFRSSRRWYYIALLATLSPLAITVASGARADSVGFSHGIPWYSYLYSQGWAIARYVKLALWPDRLTYDYGENAIHGIGGALGLLALAIVGVATVAAWIRPGRRWLWLAFLSAMFFILLAPSSSVVPIRTEIAAERRMYLALVPVIVMIAVGLESARRQLQSSDAGQRRKLLTALVAVGALYAAASYWTGRVIASAVGASGTASLSIGVAAQLAIGVVVAGVVYFLVTARDRRWTIAGIGAALVLTSASRSRLYADAERLWKDTVAKEPANPRAYDNLAAAVIRKDSTRAVEAGAWLRKAIAVDSTYVTAFNNLAAIELQRGRTDEARRLLEQALRINPDYVDASERLGALLVKSGDTPTAIANLERVVAVHPTEEALSALSIAYMSAGRREEAKTTLRRLVALNPHRADALSYLAAMLSEEGHPDQAVGFIESAVREGSASPASYALLSFTYAQLGRAEESARAASVAAAQPGVDASIFLQLGRAMMMSKRPQDADRFFSRATELEPNNPEAITRLGIAKASNGDTKSAIALFRRALAVAPGYEPAMRALAAAPPSAK
jgi:tetratricopeptide (TPR) repeat protein